MPKVSFPARCAVAVVCGEHLISQVYPASVPVEVFIDDIVELRELVPHGLEGAIVGKALYAKAFTLAQALDVASS